MQDIGLIGAKKEDSAHIRDTDATRFEADVLAVSLKKPVIVDFWAPWCGPCKQMMPALEKAVNDAQGSVALVKVNIDANPDLAQAFRVQSVPMVYAFYQGQPVDGFLGAKSPSEIAAFIAKLQKLGGSNENAGPVNHEDVKRLMSDAEKFFAQDAFNDAMAIYSTVLDADPENMEALSGIGWCFVAQKDAESLLALFAELKDTQRTHPRIKGLSLLLEKGSQAPAEVPATPATAKERYDAALHAIATLDIEAAIDMLIELIKKDREWEDQKARKLLLDLFEAMGSAHPLTRGGRRKLSAVLFS